MDLISVFDCVYKLWFTCRIVTTIGSCPIPSQSQLDKTFCQFLSLKTFFPTMQFYDCTTQYLLWRALVDSSTPIIISSCFWLQLNLCKESIEHRCPKPRNTARGFLVCIFPKFPLFLNLVRCFICKNCLLKYLVETGCGQIVKHFCSFLRSSSFTLKTYVHKHMKKPVQWVQSGKRFWQNRLISCILFRFNKFMFKDLDALNFFFTLLWIFDTA